MRTLVQTQTVELNRNRQGMAVKLWGVTLCVSRGKMKVSMVC